MQKVSSFSCETWISSVDSHYQTKPEKRYSLPLFWIVKTFKQHIEHLRSQLNGEKKKSLAEKIKILSEEKLEYYKNSRFGWIKKFFSCLRNYWALGTFKTSGQLGLEFSQQFLQQVQGQANHEPSVSNGKRNKGSTGPKVVGPKREAKDEVRIGLGLDTHERKDRDEKKADQNENHSRLTEKRGTVKRGTVKAKELKTPANSTPYENLLNTFQTVWSHANDVQRKNIRKIGEAIFKHVRVKSWKPSGKTNEYELELEKEMSAPLCTKGLQVGKLILKNKMTIVFTEIKNPTTNKYTQVVAFRPNKNESEGIYTFMGRGWISKTTPMEPIFIEQNSDGITQCTITIIQKMVKPIDNALKHLGRLKWS